MVKKRPKWKTEPHPSKTVPPRPGPPSYHDFKPSWRIGAILLVHGDFGFHEIDATALKNLQQRLRGYECRTWQEILHSSRDSPDHFPTVDKMSKEAQKLLQESGVGDIDEVISLRIGKRGRMWGIMQENGALLILWWDPKHLVYPMNIADN